MEAVRRLRVQCVSVITAYDAAPDKFATTDA
jgi:hypothetical protein